MPKLCVENVTKQYPTRSQPLEVLRGVSLTLDPGENLAVLGPSGSGKSTLLSIIGTLESPTSGSVTLDGVDPAALEGRAGRLPQPPHRLRFPGPLLAAAMFGAGKRALPAVPLGAVEDATFRRAEMLLERVGLAATATTGPPSFPAASGNVRPWPAA